MIETAVKPAAIRYFNQSGMPTLLAAFAAIVLVFKIALDAHANSDAKIPSPASNTNKPGPGAKRKTVPTIVINPPITPTKIRQIREP